MAESNWIAVDWGTSALRAWRMAGARALEEAASDQGMARVAPGGFEPALLDLVSPWLQTRTPVIACGMVGARQGWIEAPYLSVPCPLADARALVQAPTQDPRLDVRIAPGISQATPPDVMRGEETQIAGYLALNPGFDGVICLPGTHSKWAHISAGEIVSFRTFLSGELFALLSQHSVLRHGIGEGWDDAAFLEAAEETLSRPERLAAALFGIRAAGLLAGLAGDAARARLSGLLLGAELAAAKPYWLGQALAVIGAPALAGHYAALLRAQGAAPVLANAAAMTRAGLTALYQEGL